MPAAATHDGAIPIRRLAAALVAIAVLAFVLPFSAVRALHQGRLDDVRRDLEQYAGHLRDVNQRWPEGVSLLSGPGAMPPAQDARWISGATYPLERGDATPDPWGNAYVVNLGARGGGGAAIWILSAGPNGIIDTPFLQPANSAVAHGDDCAVRIR